jgi:hypothetical protein
LTLVARHYQVNVVGPRETIFDKKVHNIHDRNEIASLCGFVAFNLVIAAEHKVASETFLLLVSLTAWSWHLLTHSEINKCELNIPVLALPGTNVFKFQIPVGVTLSM